MDNGNYGQWRLFFESTPGKFGLKGHVRTTIPPADRDGEWRMVDSCIVNWILATVSTGIFDMVRRDRHPSSYGTPLKACSGTTNCSAPSSSKLSCAPYNKATCPRTTYHELSG